MGSSPFSEASVQQCKDWTIWSLQRTKDKNPFHYEDRGGNWQVAQPNSSIYYLAGTSGYSEDEDTIGVYLSGKESREKSAVGGGKAANRGITITQKRDILVPLYTEWLSREKYSDLANANEEKLKEEAKKIVNKIGNPPPSDKNYVRFDNEKGTFGQSSIKLITSNLIELTVADNNVFGQPKGTAHGVFCGYWVLVNKESLIDNHKHYLEFIAGDNTNYYVNVQYSIKCDFDNNNKK